MATRKLQMVCVTYTVLIFIFDSAMKDKNNLLKLTPEEGVWVAQSVKQPTLPQVTISQFLSSSPTSGSVLIAQTLCLPLSLPLPSLSLSLSQK